MPFLLSSKNFFIIVDQKARQGLFYQIYSSTGFSRPFQIQSFSSNCYTATLDYQSNLHVIAQNAKNQIIHYNLLEGTNTPTLLLDDSRDIYKFSNLMTYELDRKLHLFYTAIRPNTQTYSLVHQLTQQPSAPIDHLITNFNPTLPLKSICHDNQVDIFFVTSNEQGYSLNCITYPSPSSAAYKLITCEFPITSFDVCFIGGVYHITYTQDIYGNYQLTYANSQNFRALPLHASSQLGNPCILSYLGHLWITYLDNGVLYTLLSINNGQSFSSPVRSSLQDNLYNYTYYSTRSTSLSAGSLYAMVSSRVRLAIISSIDTEEIHPDLPANIELDLLLDGLSLAAFNNFSSANTPVSRPNPTPISTPIPEPMPEPSSPYSKAFVLPETMPNQDLTKEATPTGDSPVIPRKKPRNSILSATKAFMNETPTFDAPPINLE